MSGDAELRRIVEEFRQATAELAAVWDDSRGRQVLGGQAASLQEALDQQLRASDAQAEAFGAAEQLGELVDRQVTSADVCLEAFGEALARAKAGSAETSTAAHTAIELARRSDEACGQAMQWLQQAVPCGGEIPISGEAKREMAWFIAKPVLIETGKLLAEQAAEAITGYPLPDGTADRVIENAHIAEAYIRGASAERKQR